MTVIIGAKLFNVAAAEEDFPAFITCYQPINWLANVQQEAGPGANHFLFDYKQQIIRTGRTL